MESSINTNESSGIESEEKKLVENKSIKNEEKEKLEEKINNNNEEIKEDKNESNIILKNLENINDSKVNNNKNDNDINKDNPKQEEDNKNIENKIDENIDNPNQEEDIKNNENDKKKEISQNEIQYSNSLLEKVKKYNIQRMPDNYDKEDLNCKILFLGDSGVGKSTLVIRGIKNTYDSFYNPTVGFDILNYIVKIEEKVIKLQVWDTCGQEEFSMCNQSLFKNSTIAIMVYSIVNKKSYVNIKKWISRVKNLSNENPIFFLVGNKSDLLSQREVNFNEAKKWGKEKFEFFVETSSKYGYNVDILFKEMAIYLYENKLRNESLDGKEDSGLDQYLSDENSSFLDTQNIELNNKKKCPKCC
jgi:small GTP-binding protein